jgi:hypothetical protein
MVMTDKKTALGGGFLSLFCRNPPKQRKGALI